MAINLLFFPGSGRSRHDYPWLTQTLEGLGSLSALENPLDGTVHDLHLRSDRRYDHFTLRQAICFDKNILDPEIATFFTRPPLLDQLSTMTSEPLVKYLSKTILIGHSQGAGNALCLARKYTPLGLILLSGPSDPIPLNSKSWTSSLSFLSSRMALFVHADDRHFRNCLLHANQMTLSEFAIIDSESSVDKLSSKNLFLDCRHVRMSRPHYAHSDLTEYEDFNRELITALIHRFSHEN